MEFQGFSKKQREVLKHPFKKLTVYTGGVRGGKTFLTYFNIPELIQMFPKGKGIILGKTLASMNENVLEPMRSLYGKYVGDVKTDSSGRKYCIIFGKKVRCVGATDAKAESKIRGATYSWAVGDEVSTWDRKTFDMLMSRLSDEGSICVVTTNPEDVNHWFNQDYLLKDGIDKAVHTFTIDDNPYLDKAYVENLKNIYRGTVLFDRYILGLWASGSGAIYKRFITEPEKFIIDDNEIDRSEIVDYSIGVDFGENTSATTFKLLGLKRNYKGFIVLAEKHIEEHKDFNLLEKQFIEWLRECLAKGYKISNCYYDYGQKTLGESLKSSVIREGLPCVVQPCIKDEIKERVDQEIVLFGAYMIQIAKSCEWSIKAFKEAVYEENSDKRLDIVSPKNPVDELDAIEYAFQKWIKNLMMIALYKREQQ